MLIASFKGKNKSFKEYLDEATRKLEEKEAKENAKDMSSVQTRA